MYLFLVPLLAGFGFDLASAFTTAYSHRWGPRAGQLISILLRDLLGIPTWFLGLILALWQEGKLFWAAGPAPEVLAWILLLGGCVPMVFGLWALRTPAALPSTRDVLVAHGIYAHIRHPIYCGMLLEFVGLILISPKLTTLVACTLGLAWVIAQARLEEIDLVQRIPGYAEYMQRVPRFLPRFQKK